MARLVYRVTATADDCSEYTGGTSGFFDNFLGSGLEDNVLNYRVNGGVRFTNIRVPQGTTIESAQLCLFGTTTSIPGSSYGRWYGDDVDDAAAFVSSTSITQTTANTAVSTGSNDKQLVTHNVTAIVQEIVDRSGWEQGNAMRFATNSATADGYMQFYDYSSDSLYAPYLIIDTPTDITGHGAFPLMSSWLKRRGSRGASAPRLYQALSTGSTDDSSEMWNDWFFINYGFVKRWDGSSWIPKPVKHWDGTNWLIKPLFAWDGTEWVTYIGTD